MKISVIIPVYNSEKFLDTLLKSIVMQTYKNYEVILVDDGSTDGSIKIIQNYEKQNDLIKHISIENSGPGVARRKGFEISTGDLLFFVDSDDYIPSDKVFKKIVDIYDENKFDILFFDVKLNKEGKEIIGHPFKNVKAIKSGRKSIEYINEHLISAALWQKIFVKKKMKKEYFCDYKNFEDFYTTYMYLNNCENFYYTKEIFYYSNRDNENSLSKQMDLNKIFNTIDLLKITYDKSKYKFPVSQMMALYYIYVRRRIQISNYNKKNKKECIKKFKELKEYFNVWKLLKMKLPLKIYLKYIYYKINDIVIG